MSERALIGLGLLFIGVIVFAKGASDSVLADSSWDWCLSSGCWVNSIPTEIRSQSVWTML